MAFVGDGLKVTNRNSAKSAVDKKEKKRKEKKKRRMLYLPDHPVRKPAAQDH